MADYKGVPLPDVGGDENTWGDKLNDETFPAIVDRYDPTLADATVDGTTLSFTRADGGAGPSVEMPQGPEGPEGPQGAPGGSDEATAQWIESGTLTRDALDAFIGPPVTKAELGLDQVDNTADIDKPVSDATRDFVESKMLTLQSPPAGRFAYLNISGEAGTGAATGAGSLRLSPWLVHSEVTVDALAVDIVGLGSEGATFRLAIYADQGRIPGTLVLDAGSIPAGLSDSTGIVIQPFGEPLTLPAGLYWVGAAAQNVGETEPQIRTTGAWTPPIPITVPSLAPGATVGRGVIVGGVTGSPPASLGTSYSSTIIVPRIAVRYA